MKLDVLIGAVDASFTMDTLTRRLHDGAVSWKSGLQSTVTLSSCEAEYIPLCSEVPRSEVRYLPSLLHALGFKHLDIRFKFVAQTIVDNIVLFRYTPTETNLTDILTKALPRTTFERLRQRLLCRDIQLGNYHVSKKG